MMLIVRGEIANLTREETSVPDVVFAMFDNSGREFFQWTESPATKRLAKGGISRFHATIPAPASKVKRLMVRFARY